LIKNAFAWISSTTYKSELNKFIQEEEDLTESLQQKLKEKIFNQDLVMLKKNIISWLGTINRTFYLEKQLAIITELTRKNDEARQRNSVSSEITYNKTSFINNKKIRIQNSLSI
jgi:hypothetical protein